MPLSRVRPVQVAFAVSVLLALAYTAWLVAGSPEHTLTASDWAYNLAIVGAGVTCLLRANSQRELRGAWAAIGMGLGIWAIGDVYWLELFRDVEDPPYPSWADAMFLGSLALLFVGVVLLVKHRVKHFGKVSWLDVLIGAISTGALATALIAPVLVGATDAETEVVIVNLAYPVGDLFLIAILVGALAVTGLRQSAALLVLAAGLLVWAGTDVTYLYMEATDGYFEGWHDLGWVVGALIIALAACLPTPARTSRSQSAQASLIYPVQAASVATAILVWDHFDRLYSVAVLLAGLTLVAVAVRLVLSIRENYQLVDDLARETITDSLTGLANRNRLADELEDLVGIGPSLEEHVFALFDLDGFKDYNDSFGIPAGDAMLAQLARSLAESVAPRGVAFRVGSDEFAVLAPTGDRGSAWVVEKARAALTARGKGFTVGASAGWLSIPGDHNDASAIMRVADRKLHEEKRRRRGGSVQAKDVLLSALQEREPTLGAHTQGVTDRAVAVGRLIGLDPEELDTLSQAAELHDVGKIGIPDEILLKPEPLDEMEMDLMRRHTLIGERIISTAPGMKPVGRLVRSSHERWDGQGYPDGLAREEIPLGSRIIFVCDSFDAMTSDRVYRPRMSEREALAELRRGAGTQFDPEVIEAFCSLVESAVGSGAAGAAAR